MNIWTVDRDEILSEINARNAIRKSALLPLLDEQKEFERTCMVIRHNRWHEFKESNKVDYERFRDEVYAERGAPSSFMGRWMWHIDINKRFEAFLRANYANQIATIMRIVPDYLRITRLVVEQDQSMGLEIEPP